MLWLLFAAPLRFLKDDFAICLAIHGTYILHTDYRYYAVRVLLIILLSFSPHYVWGAAMTFRSLKLSFRYYDATMPRCNY